MGGLGLNADKPVSKFLIRLLKAFIYSVLDNNFKLDGDLNLAKFWLLFVSCVLINLP